MNALKKFEAKLLYILPALGVIYIVTCILLIRHMLGKQFNSPEGAQEVRMDLTHAVNSLGSGLDLAMGTPSAKGLTVGFPSFTLSSGKMQSPVLDLRSGTLHIRVFPELFWGAITAVAQAQEPRTSGSIELRVHTTISALRSEDGLSSEVSGELTVKKARIATILRILQTTKDGLPFGLSARSFGGELSLTGAANIVGGKLLSGAGTALIHHPSIRLPGSNGALHFNDGTADIVLDDHAWHLAKPVTLKDIPSGLTLVGTKSTGDVALVVEIQGAPPLLGQLAALTHCGSANGIKVTYFGAGWSC